LNREDLFKEIKRGKQQGRPSQITSQRKIKNLKSAIFKDLKEERDSQSPTRSAEGASYA
jgi:hypothetical protein